MTLLKDAAYMLSRRIWLLARSSPRDIHAAGYDRHHGDAKARIALRGVMAVPTSFCSHKRYIAKVMRYLLSARGHCAFTSRTRPHHARASLTCHALGILPIAVPRLYDSMMSFD